MISDEDAAEAIREGLQALPALAAHSTGQVLTVDQIFFPLSHAEALDPDVTLVVGNRGMGKSFWASALAQKETRDLIEQAYPRSHSVKLKNVEVRFAFADAEGAVGSVSRSDIEALPADTPRDLIWRAAIIRQLVEYTDETIPKSFVHLVNWLRDDPSIQQRIFREADQRLIKGGKKMLFLFDQLDQLADDWAEILALTQGILRVSLAMRSYRSLRTKIFMRPDQAESRELFRFPDASKISGGRVRLRWRAIDLYGLVFFELLRNSVSREAFKQACVDCGLDPGKEHSRLRIPSAIAFDDVVQHRVFARIAGEYMGKSEKRGRPYTWIPVHLADAKGEVSPRTFFAALKTAAHHRPNPSSTAIDHLGIQEGVRQASENRLAELQEDYPWVTEALEPLRGLLVPIDFVEIQGRWELAEVAKRILARHRGAKIPLGLELADLFDEGGEQALLQNLTNIGVVEVRSNGKVNVPDIFRIKAGILRKGGVTPQQRSKL